MRPRLLQKWLSRILPLIGLLLMSRGNAQTSNAPTIDLEAGHEPITVLSTEWKFHPGNDPEWAAPGYNDADWKLLKVSKDWDTQGYREEQNQAWFRFTVLVPANTPGLLMTMPRIHKCYQLFANGVMFGQSGHLPPEPSTSITGAARLFTVPLTTSPQPQRIMLALRLWQSPAFTWAERDEFGEVLIGEPDPMQARFENQKLGTLVAQRGMDFTTQVFSIPLIAAALLLFWLTRKSLYLWFAADNIMGIVTFVVVTLASHYAWRSDVTLGSEIAIDIASSVANGMFLLGLIELRRSRWLNLSILLSIAGELSTLLVALHLSFFWADTLFFIFNSLGAIIRAGLLYRAWRRGAKDAGLFFVPTVLAVIVQEALNLGYCFLDAGIGTTWLLRSANYALIDKPFGIRIVDATNLILLFGYLAVMVYRFARISHEEQRLSAALQAAHQIQSSLLPADHSVYGNLQAEVVYLAAEEVGGDFCQILPRSDGSILVVIGDVAGKGLQAAMVGSIAVGALRSMTETTVTPGSLLSRMNDAMCRGAERVFITCLCVELTPDGTMTVANGGHLCPYLNGVEIECDSGFPLGVIANVEYAERTLTLPETARITLISDGVVEARAKSGELFGFDRTLEVSALSAEEIASVAKQFGQEDDITVVTLDWSKAPIFTPESLAVVGV